MLQQIKVLLGITDNSKDTLLTLLIHQAEDEVINYTHNAEAVPFVESTIVQMVVFKFNRLRTEGLDSENYSGVSYSYSSDYPQSILRQLNAYRKLRTL